MPRSTRPDAYSPVPTCPIARDLLPLELLAVDRASSRPLNLALNTEGLVVLKQRAGTLHSLKLGNPSSTSTRSIPYLNLLSATATHPPLDPSSSAALSNEHHSTLTLTALVPSKKGDPTSPLRLWSLTATVHEVGGAAHAGADGEAKRCAVDDWCKEFEARAYAGIKRRRRLHCIVNPIGGKGKAKAVWKAAVQPVFNAAGCEYTVSYTGAPFSPTNARALALAHDPSAFDALVALSGDGIVHELLNGLASQPGSGARALRETPVVHVPCGSGNALATSLYGPERVADPGQPRLYTFLTQAFGLMADLDLGTEHLRWMGDARFTLGYVQGAVGRRRYPCRVDVCVAPPGRGGGSKAALARRHNARLDAPAQEGGSGAWEKDEMPPLKLGGADVPLPKAVRTLERLPADGELDEEGWYTLDLSEGGVFFAYGGKVPFVSKDVMLFPAADPSDGLLDLVLVAPMSPLSALTAMDNAATGGLLALPSVTYLKCSAYRLSFPPPANGKKEGFISVDGERVPYAPFQVECHRGLARVMGMGKWEGRRRIEGFEGE
ncbi:sphinganine kinase lcb4 [Rhodotorula kratochvilovae]